MKALVYTAFCPQCKHRMPQLGEVEINESVLSIRVLDIADQLSMRTLNGLYNNLYGGDWEVLTLREVVQIKSSDLRKTKNFGNKSLLELVEFLSVRGLQLDTVFPK